MLRDDELYASYRNLFEEFSNNSARRRSADPAVALAPPRGGQIDPIEDQGQVGDGEFDPRGARELRGARGRLQALVATDLQPLDVGITIPSFLVRYTIFARSVCRRHESSAPMAIDRDGSWE